ncbi:hypothetical protein [Brevibacterium litoralis]|uniref:hypothetical protein n=1 Tax=Brevibacterium litoralis TaxID=3138935 RepID=UPI0032EFD9D1
MALVEGMAVTPEELLAHLDRLLGILSLGDAEVVKRLSPLLVDLAPDARAAVEAGVADPSVLDLPGVRELAGRKGSSRAVKLARQVLDRLPS